MACWSGVSMPPFLGSGLSRSMPHDFCSHRKLWSETNTSMRRPLTFRSKSTKLSMVLDGMPRTLMSRSTQNFCVSCCSLLEPAGMAARRFCHRLTNSFASFLLAGIPDLLRRCHFRTILRGKSPLPSGRASFRRSTVSQGPRRNPKTPGAVGNSPISQQRHPRFSTLSMAEGLLISP